MSSVLSGGSRPLAMPVTRIDPSQLITAASESPSRSASLA